jgi:hypothetical protein
VPGSYLTRSGGYYFNAGCSDLIVKGEVEPIQFSDIAEFVTNGVRLRCRTYSNYLALTIKASEEGLISRLSPFDTHVNVKVDPRSRTARSHGRAH